MSVANFIQQNRIIESAYKEIIQKKLLTVKVEGEEIIFHHNLPDDGNISLAAFRLLKACKGHLRDCQYVFGTGRLFIDGPRIFRPTLEQCEALKQIEVKLEFKDYAQPFEVMCVEYPKNFDRKYETNDPRGGTKIVEPDFTILCWIPETTLILCNLVHRPGEGWQGIVGSVGQTGNKEIESWLNPVSDPSQGIEFVLRDQETTVNKELDRIALNSMLMLMEFGCKNKGYDNESYAKSLQRRIERKVRTDLNKAELHLLGQEFVLEQEVTLYNHSRTVIHSDNEEQLRKPAKPHIRRGHWKMVAHGIGHSLRKRMLIKPTKVNWHLLNQEPNGSVVYKVKD